MTVLLALLGKAWPYMLAFGGGLGFGIWSTHAVDTIALNRQKAAQAGWQAQQADKDRDAEKAAREALQAQIDQRHAVDVNNEQVMNDLKKRTADAESHYAADRDFINRMLNSASSKPTSGHPVPAPDAGSGSAPASEANGIAEVAELCAATKAEDEWNANQLDALNAELNKQVPP